MSIGHLKAAFEYTSENKVQLIRGGRSYFDLLLQLINRANDCIHLQTYIFDDDETGNKISEALKAAVKRKVEVYVIVDGYASQALHQKFINELRNAGIKFKFFEPIFRSKYFYFGRRLHHKMVVIDATFALVGGINISNRYNDMPGQPAWLDFALLVEGEIARELCVLCWKTWNGFTIGMKITPCEEKEIIYSINPEEASQVRMRRQDWVRGKNQVSRTYVEMLSHSRSQVIILCSYFLPGRAIRRLMKNASQRGVKIKVIAAGRSDVKTAKYAERWLYDWLLRNKIELYEYQKNILHGKIAVCDSEWMTVGSYNVNDISAHASIELNLDVKNKAFAKHTETILENIIQNDCIPISKEYHIHKKNIVKQFVRWLSYHFIRTILYLFTFYFKRKE
jgi:cardiolipin synthase A/B